MNISRNDGIDGARGVVSARLPVVVTFLLSATLLFLSMDRTVNIFDEGLILTDAMRTLAGDLDHRDYYSSYAPGNYYVVATLFALFKHGFLAARLYGVLVMAAIVATSFALLFGRIRFRICLLFCGMIGLWLFATPYYLYPIFPCLLLALVSTGFLLRGIEGKRSQFLAAGVCAGAAALFRYDSGAFLLVAQMIALGIHYATAADFGPWPRRVVSAVLPYGLGAALVILPIAVAFAVSGMLPGLYLDIVDYSTRYYVKMRGLPFPGPLEILRHPPVIGVYLPIVALLSACAELVGRRARGVGDRADDDALLLMLAMVTAFFFYKGMVRVSNLHMLMSIIPGTLVLAMLVDRWWGRRGAIWRAGLIVALASGTICPLLEAARALKAYAAAPGVSVVGWAWQSARLAPPVVACPSCPATWGALTPYDYASVAHFLNRFTRPDEKILAALDRHDRILVNPVALYFLANRLPGTHWHQFDPGLQTRADIQRLIVRDLQKNHVRWVVRDANFSTANEPNDSSLSSGVHVLDQYLDTHYHPVAKAGLVQLWLIDGAVAPAYSGREPCMPLLIMG